MSVTSIHQCKNLKGLIDYCVTPKKNQVTERVAKMYCDLGNETLFLKYGKSIHRKIKAYSLLQSFPQEEFKSDNPKHIDIVNELGRKLAYALYPNSPCLVVTHADTNHVHNHIMVLNVDLDTNGCITSNRRFTDVSRENDELMKRYGLQVCGPSEQPRTQGEYWTNKRTGWLDQLKESLDKVLAFATSIQEFQDYLLAEGITPSLYKANKTLKDRFTYSVIDSEGNVHKKRSDKLGEAYTRESIERTLLANKKKSELNSVVSMSDWLSIQQTSKEKAEPIQQETITPVPCTEVMEIPFKATKKKTELSDIPEKEKEMQEQNILQELANDKMYQELLEEKRSIESAIKLIKEKYANGTDTDEDDNALDSLLRKLSVIDFSIKNYRSSKVESSTNVKINENLLRVQPNISKKNQLSL